MSDIQIFTGLPGSGKTLYAVECILSAFCKGAYVATNIKLRLGYIRHYCLKRGVEFNRSQYIFLDSIEKCTQPWMYLPKGTEQIENLLVLDEMLEISPARAYQKTTHEFLRYFIMIRRHHHNAILICQRLGQIDKQIRDLYQYRWQFNNLKRALKIPILGGFPWEILIRVQYDQTNNHLAWRPVLIRLDVARCYYTLQEVVTIDRPPPIKERKNNHVKMDRGYYNWRFHLKILRRKIKRASYRNS